METGHEKNVKNFETIIIILVTLGAIYNPSQALIALTALQAVLTAAKNAIADWLAADAANSIAVNERQDEFSGLDKYAVNIKRAVSVEINDDAFTKDIASLVRKFQPGGRRNTGDTAAPGGETNTAGRSTSQRSYDMLIQHLTAILELVKTKNDGYKPGIGQGEDDVTIAGIEARLAALEAKNNAAKTAKINLGLAEDARDAILYNPKTGIIALIKLIKLQLARKPGKQSAAYQQVNALEFRKY